MHAKHWLLLSAKDGLDIYPIHRNQGLAYLAMQREGLVQCLPPRQPPADAVQVMPLLFVQLTPVGREAAGLQGDCDTCGLYSHDLHAGLCPACNERYSQAARPLTAIDAGWRRHAELCRGAPLPEEWLRAVPHHPFFHGPLNRCRCVVEPIPETDTP